MSATSSLAYSADFAPRNVTLKIGDAMMEHAITDVVLLEGTPLHPVVAEVRLIWRPLRLLLIGLFAAAGVLVPLEILRLVWVLWHGGSAAGVEPATCSHVGQKRALLPFNCRRNSRHGRRRGWGRLGDPSSGEWTFAIITTDVGEPLAIPNTRPPHRAL